MIAGIELLPGRWLGDPRLKGLFAVGALVIVIQVFESVLFNFLRADQETTVLMKFQVGKRYLGLALVLLTLFVISRSLMAFYWATVATEALAIAVPRSRCSSAARGAFESTGAISPDLSIASFWGSASR